jgi:hypothetical protein
MRTSNLDKVLGLVTGAECQEAAEELERYLDAGLTATREIRRGLSAAPCAVGIGCLVRSVVRCRNIDAHGKAAVPRRPEWSSLSSKRAKQHRGIGWPAAAGRCRPWVRNARSRSIAGRRRGGGTRRWTAAA